MSESDCLFCQIVAGDLPAQRVYEDERTLAFMDIAPGTRGHLLVIPKRHAANILEIEPEDLSAVALSAQHMAQRVSERLGADGVNIINSCGTAGWQTVFHLHFHVIPRYVGDPLTLPWTPAPGDAEQIAATAEELR